MEERPSKVPPCEHPGLSVGVSVSLTLVVMLVAVVGYGGYYTVDRFDRMSDQYEKMAHDYEMVKSRLEHVEQVCEKVENKHGEKREVLSSSKVDLSSLVRGPPGPTGPAGSRGMDGRDGRPGRDGLPGKDGTDFASLSLMESLLNRTIQKEWTQLSSRLPTYGGAVYTLWGRKTCPKESKMIYTGAMAGPDTRSSGGASNHQCLPSDPQYHTSTNPAKAYHSSLRPTQYWTKYMPDLSHVHEHYVPCVICETMQRISAVMIPAMTQCPTSEWVLEYSGYLMSEIEHTYNQPSNFDQTRNRASVDYICLDQNAESLTSKKRPQEVMFGGAVIHPVDADCSGIGGLTNCPPYHGNNLALACVVCSK